MTDVMNTVVPPGRLGDPAMSLGTDPRADPRMMAVFSQLGLDALAEADPVDLSVGIEQLRAMITEIEVGFEGLFTALAENAPRPDGVTYEARTIDGPDGNEITLHIHRPTGVDGPLPCIYQVHGGGMVMLSTEGPIYRNWREELAAGGAVVVGVQYRNGAGVLGSHPFPAGLNDCAAGLRWVSDHRDELGITNIVITGDSGGANLSVSLAIKAKREGWLDVISGVYAMSPFVYGNWATVPADLRSLHENDGYWLNRALFPLITAVYDPGGQNAWDPTAWPYQATDADLQGLPPHIITVNECDPLRDEGLDYHRKLSRAGVQSYARVNAGLCHVGEILFRDAMPDVYATAVRDVTGFARALA